MHFEDLWCQAEELHKEAGKEDSISSIVEELIMKLNLYRLVDERPEISDGERQIIKSRTLGEILLTITNLSYKDNIDVFEALSTAYTYHNLNKSFKI